MMGKVSCSVELEKLGIEARGEATAFRMKYEIILIILATFTRQQLAEEDQDLRRHTWKCMIKIGDL